MGQRSLTPARQPRRRALSLSSPDKFAGCIFPTDLGWFGLWGIGKSVKRLTIGHASADEVRLVVGSLSRGPAPLGEPHIEEDWHPVLRRALQDFARGTPRDFREFEVALDLPVGFRRRVLDLTRQIPYGQTMSYGELADRAGSPNAARAVGSAMASNPISIVIPCHRVIASGGLIGGFSARQGIELKRKLLDIEQSAMIRKARR